MSESMIERVAQALWYDHREMVPANAEIEHWDRLGEYARNLYRSHARAAIEAMREPTDEMIGAAEVEQADPTPGQYRDTTDRAQHIYRAMIDAALAPSTVVPGERK